ncbi:MAG: SpoIIIAH-like family protein [Clostridium sp.]|jgi:stage III sporulation protein AH|uniref:SpoIIIAH-like family protein n=1 Tax=Clostridium sp. TaxID=1506 RepID=UPI0025BEDD22|nr:SpoIIIAH-like family protein [Clostridium sp.]MCH3964149.1 SpoIIIAH-like family protein [Clostridium sp.]MCI1715330.1 SpoIIIAH-like family protein [Clostridium sp.]MCI1799879.1 SpoIIIAH-like family protein [Clostridium sp.]MCI1813513.1 SpoIIIAH-like family protein [Clostridium sp.]MCI1870697.1 SpoIIIAH-like family protein [Clostridium sp.]
MNKKQAIIIVTLLALIVCVGVLATKVNSPFSVAENSDGSTGKSAVSFNSNDSQKSKSQFFEEARLNRDQKDAETLQKLKNLIDDKNVSQENRVEAEKEYTELAMDTDYESKIETTLKSKGYEDVICSIEGSKARVIVKASDNLTDKNTREIKDVVMSISKLEDVEIEARK